MRTLVNTSTRFLFITRNMAKSTSTSLWRPGNAFSALGILIMKGSAKLPISWMQAIGKGLGTFDKKVRVEAGANQVDVLGKLREVTPC